jgi:hypothetical protein
MYPVKKNELIVLGKVYGPFLKVYTLFDENIKNHAVSLALLLIYIDFDRKVLKSIKSNSV